MAQTTRDELISKPFAQRLIYSIRIRSRMLLDKSTPHTLIRWIVFAFFVLLYLLRVWYLQGFYIVTYGLGIYLLNLFIGFLQPQDDFNDQDGPSLPTHKEDLDDFQPFIRRVPEFKFWWSATKAVLISMFLTLFSLFDIPVFWPILLLYFIVLFTITMKRQIEHMVKHSYIPCDCFKKKKYGHKNHKIVEKKKKTGIDFPKVRQPIRSMPSGGLKKVNKD
eukprot:497819_1